MSKELLEELKKWKVEAKLEDSERYFYHTDAVDSLLNGENSYVIGRKGSGKTAISEFIDKSLSPKSFSQKLTFKNFPFNALYKLGNDNYSSPNQYITLWKYVIYSSIAKLFAKNKNINPEIRAKLDKIYSDDLSNALSRAVKKWTSGSFSLMILGSGVTVQGGKQVEENLDWIDKVDILEDFILKNIDDCSYIITFDELDEDYKDIINPDKNARYKELLTSLFKAVQDIRSVFCDYKVYPVVFLRDDIYEILQDPDKTKWDDIKISLNWSEEGLKNLISFRLCRAMNSKVRLLPFNEAWHTAFSTKKVLYGNRKRKSMSAFNYISRSTQLRPRDYVKYIQLCAIKSLEKGETKILPTTVASINNEFSSYLRSELEDEIAGVIPEIHHILNLFTKIRKQTLKIEEFKELYEQVVNDTDIPSRDPIFILNILYHFSIIGGQPKQKTFQVFKYTNPGTSLNMNDNIIIHRGLYRSLQIL